MAEIRCVGPASPAVSGRQGGGRGWLAFAVIGMLISIGWLRSVVASLGAERRWEGRNGTERNGQLGTTSGPSFPGPVRQGIVCCRCPAAVLPTRPPADVRTADKISQNCALGCTGDGGEEEHGDGDGDSEAGGDRVGVKAVPSRSVRGTNRSTEWDARYCILMGG